MSKTVIFESHHVMSNAENNNNKFWRVFQYDDHSTLVEYGRVGDSPQRSEKQFGSSVEARKFCDTKCSEKVRKGYNKVEIMSSNVTVKVSTGGTLTEVARKQIKTNSTDADKLIEYFSKVNVHNILHSTNMQYNVDSGLFSTPIGIVTKATVDKARDILIKMDPFVSSKNFTKDYVKLLEEYMMLIPQQIGRRFEPSSIFTSSTDIIKQNDVLDSLEVSISSIMNATVSQNNAIQIDEPQLFKVKVNKIDDKKEIDRINKFFKSTSHNNHVSSRYNLKSVYEIEIETMKALFDAKGKHIGNVMELWHGTKASNILSILKSGLVLPNPKSANFTGAMFGLGIYGSDQSTKSLNYACGYWDGKRDNNPYMFLCDFAMGKMYTPSGPSQNLPKPGYDSTYAIGGKSGVANNEMIVYDLAQVNLTRLCEFG